MLKGWNTSDIYPSKTLQLSSIGGPWISTVWTQTLWSTSPPCTRHLGRLADHRPSCHHLGFLLPSSPHIFIPIDVFLPVTPPVTNTVMLCRNPWQTYKPNKTPKNSAHSDRCVAPPLAVQSPHTPYTQVYDHCESIAGLLHDPLALRPL